MTPVQKLQRFSFLPGPPEGFVCGRCDQVSVFKGRRDGSGCHQAADVSHVGQQVGVNAGAELEETLKVLLTNICIQI